MRGRCTGRRTTRSSQRRLHHHKRHSDLRAQLLFNWQQHWQYALHAYAMSSKFRKLGSAEVKIRLEIWQANESLTSLARRGDDEPPATRHSGS